MSLRQPHPFWAIAAASALAVAVPGIGHAQGAAGSLADALAQQQRPKLRYNQGWRGAGEVAVLWAPIGGGGWGTTYDGGSGTGHESIGGNYQAIMHVGLRAAGYLVVGCFQIGVFGRSDLGKMSYTGPGDHVEDGDPVAADTAAGIAVKWTFPTRKGVLVGPAADLGLAVHHADVKNPDVRTQFGIDVAPRFALEFPVGERRSWAVNFAFGLHLFIVDGEALESTDRITTRWTRIEPIVLFGASFGG